MEGPPVLHQRSGGSVNIWTTQPDGSDAAPTPPTSDWDVRNAALGDGRIVYQLGADLHVFDLASGGDRRLTFDLVSDFDQLRSRLVNRRSSS